MLTRDVLTRATGITLHFQAADADTGAAAAGGQPAKAAMPAAEQWEGHELDCYPYTFSPLLLFAENGYFDKGEYACII